MMTAFVLDLAAAVIVGTLLFFVLRNSLRSRASRRDE
jgi:hypothetical protein